MNTAGRCPPDDDLCALFDDEAGRRAGRLRQHVAGCARCAGRLLAFAEVRSELLPLQRLPEVGGIADAVLLRLPRRRARPRLALPWLAGSEQLTHTGTRLLGAAAALAAGSVLGLFLVAGGAVADRTGMSVFSAEPGRQLCLGLPSCGR